MNISFTKKQEEYISKQVASGEYQNNSEVNRRRIKASRYLSGKSNPRPEERNRASVKI